jgi:hypothetical protein
MARSDGKANDAPPLTWPEVIEQLAPVFEEGLFFYDDLPQEIAGAKPPRYGGARFGGFDTTMAALAVLRGPKRVASIIDKMAPSLDVAIEQIGPTLDRNRYLAAYFTLNTMNVARCCGCAVPKNAAALEADWLEQLTEWTKQLPEPDRHTAALAACAANKTKLVPTFAELPALDKSFTAGQTFAFNVPAFAGYLAVAIDTSASYQDVELAWLDFVHRFPYKLEASTLDWPALLWAARAVYTTIGKLPEDEVAAELHKLLTNP